MLVPAGTDAAAGMDEEEAGRLGPPRWGSLSFLFNSTASSPSGNDSTYSFSANLFALIGELLGFSLLTDQHRYAQYPRSFSTTHRKDWPLQSKKKLNKKKSHCKENRIIAIAGHNHCMQQARTLKIFQMHVIHFPLR